MLEFYERSHNTLEKFTHNFKINIETSELYDKFLNYSIFSAMANKNFTTKFLM